MAAPAMAAGACQTCPAVTRHQAALHKLLQDCRDPVNRLPVSSDFRTRVVCQVTQPSLWHLAIGHYSRW
jgi:hypothetical protein